jgi:serine/threonine-protein kinase HipA
MGVGIKSAHDKFVEFQPRDWKAVELRSGIPFMWERMCELVAGVPAAVERVAGELPPDFPHSVSNAVFVGAQRHAQRFLSGISVPDLP